MEAYRTQNRPHRGAKLSAISTVHVLVRGVWIVRPTELSTRRHWSLWITCLSDNFAPLPLAGRTCYRVAMDPIVDPQHEAIEHIARLLIEQAQAELNDSDT